MFNLRARYIVAILGGFRWKPTPITTCPDFGGGTERTDGWTDEADRSEKRREASRVASCDNWDYAD